jgi:hypothetical protein
VELAITRNPSEMRADFGVSLKPTSPSIKAEPAE